MPDELLDQVKKLGAEFVRRGMDREATTLRLYFLALRAKLVRGPEAELSAAAWSREKTLEWLRLLQVPPWHNAYQLGTRGAPCRRCKPGKGGSPAAVEEFRWAGGALVRCSGCSARWVVDDEEERRDNALIVH